MNFKQFFTEAKDISKRLEITDITDAGMFGPEVIKAWQIIEHVGNDEYAYFLTLDDKDEYGMYDLEGNDVMIDNYIKDLYIRAVKKQLQKHEMMKQGLTDLQANTAINI
jgi:hypothetical protein